jgi:glycerophosphoryl diester phosphodiesterase
MHDETLDRTTKNSSGYVCELTTAQLQNTVVSSVDVAKSGVSCENAGDLPGAGLPGCVFRVPTLDQVLSALDSNVRLMIDAKVCFVPGVESTSGQAVSCNTCSGQIVRLKELLTKHKVANSRLVLTSTDLHSLTTYRDAFPGASTALSVDFSYARYTVSQFVELLNVGKWDSVALYYGIAGARPDLVAATRSTGRLVYAWTVRKDWQARVAICSGADALIVADPRHFAQLFSSQR